MTPIVPISNYMFDDKRLKSVLLLDRFPRKTEASTLFKKDSNVEVYAMNVRKKKESRIRPQFYNVRDISAPHLEELEERSRFTLDPSSTIYSNQLRWDR